MTYSAEAAGILALDGDGQRLMPLVAKGCSTEAVREKLRGTTAAALFPEAAQPEAAMAGLWLYFSCLEEAHTLAQDIDSAEGSFWHAIVHRQEPDYGNSAYWFRKVGPHPIFRPLAEAAREIVGRHPQAEFRTGLKWDPFAFVMFCERARQQPGSSNEHAAMEIQRAEWQLLFDYCARPKSEA